MGDVAMGGMLSPSRIDKSSRYGKTGSQKKHTPGKGEIRSRSPIKGALMRKRKRHNLDKDVGSVVRYQLPDSEDSEDDSESSKYSRGRRSRSKTRRDEPRGFFGSIFHMLDEHPNAPDNLHRWIQLGLNLVFISTILGIGWSIYATIRSDILNANSAAREELRAEIFQCQQQFEENDCRNTKAPALKAICQQWRDCMLQNPDTVMRVKVTIKQIAEIINEFSEAMNFKAWVRCTIAASFLLVLTVDFRVSSSVSSLFASSVTTSSPVEHHTLRPRRLPNLLALQPWATSRRSCGCPWPRRV